MKTRIETFRAIREEMIRQGGIGVNNTKDERGRGCALGVLWKRECPSEFAASPPMECFTFADGSTIYDRLRDNYSVEALADAQRAHDRIGRTYGPDVLPEDERYLRLLCWLDEQIGDPLPVRLSATPAPGNPGT